ncbi:MAG: PilZ domain-containing protein [Hyphomonadaceae bacterium]
MLAHASLRLADAAMRLGAQRKTARDRRRFRRVPLAVSGRLMDPAGREHVCSTADVSPGDARFLSSADVQVGDRVVFYLDALGRLEGHVVRRIAEGEFAVVLAGTPHKRERLAETLTWLISRDRMGEQIEARPAPRFQAGAIASISLEDGPAIEGEVLDFSLVGMAVRTRQQRPPIGAWVRVGGVYGRVARYFENGFGVDFESRALYAR